jgi:hypothetical protein
MDSIDESRGLANLPAAELTQDLKAFLQPVLAQLPEQRLREVAWLAVRGVLTAQSPLLTEMARAGEPADAANWALARRFYRFMWNARFTHRHLLKGLYGIAQTAVKRYDPPYLVVAIDPVNFEKPYTVALPGVSTVRKSTPPGPGGHKRLTAGYPAITATVVNLPEPVITYANWFSYKTPDFVSEPWEIYRAIRTTRSLFPHTVLRFVGDAGLDDQTLFRRVAHCHSQFIFRVGHANRLVEVYNERLHRWDPQEHLAALAETVPWTHQLAVTFHHARTLRQVTVRLGWLQLRIPDTQQIVWALVIRDPDRSRRIILLTNIPITTAQDAELVYTEWRCRPQIEHTYRFDQEQGLDVEDLRVRTLERMRRVFILVLLATLFLYHINRTWPHQAIAWLRRLGGKLGLRSDSDGPYVLLAGIRAVFTTATTWAYARRHPFPRPNGTYG